MLREHCDGSTGRKGLCTGIIFSVAPRRASKIPEKGPFIFSIILRRENQLFYLRNCSILAETDICHMSDREERRSEYLYLQGWAINSYRGQHESPALCQRATIYLLLRAYLVLFNCGCIKLCLTLRELPNEKFIDCTTDNEALDFVQ